MRSTHLFVSVFVALLVLGGVVRADIASTAGAMTEIAPPASVVVGALESSSTIFVFDEGVSTVPLTPDLFFDHIGPGSFEGTPPPYFLMPKGAMLHSYLVHFDPVGTAHAALTGSITFDPGEAIVGIQAHTPDLYSTDGFFGDPGVTYPAGGTDLTRGFDTFITIDDTGSVAFDLNSVTFMLAAELGVDEARIFTVIVPEPSCLALAFVGVGLILPRRRRTA
ncbi:hypothetical protein N9N28_15585 [Rubripirellula amarantea]|nr:hypothetical protein [Rubripirellula amarantea]